MNEGRFIARRITLREAIKSSGLIRRKYSDSEIELILGGNFKRALTAIWTVTAEQ
ncbi:MAG TPA: hypothetical protein VJO16_15790 [Candidatus Acidoferrum sp.]|nr:hypothetical protein [Candidatus Acidoferrum sp.]